MQNHLVSKGTTGGVVPDSVGHERIMMETVAEYKRSKPSVEGQLVMKLKLGAFGVMLFMCTLAGVLLDMGSSNLRSEKNLYYLEDFVIAFSSLSTLPFVGYP